MKVSAVLSYFAKVIISYSMFLSTVYSYASHRPFLCRTSQLVNISHRKYSTCKLVGHFVNNNQARFHTGALSSFRDGDLYSEKTNFSQSCINHDYKRVYVAVGANLGDRFQNLMLAISKLNDTTCAGADMCNPIVVKRTSFLRETAPMYVEDQPNFLNGAIEIETFLSPHDLLTRLKQIESDIGRDLHGGVRYGPRPIDLDIIYYDIGKESGGIIIQSSSLQVPHPRMHERDFVLSPICDINPNIIHPLTNMTAKEMLYELKKNSRSNHNGDSAMHDMDHPAVRVLPLPHDRMLRLNQTHIMGILNLTPDSFSDGGKYKGSVDLAVERAFQLVEDGATILDIGGESTRPGAKEVDTDTELTRTIPVIQRLREASKDIIISIDTRHAVVAKAAVEAGADIVNDVSGGTYDPLMLETVAQLKVPMIIMHMRGTPETMQSMTKYTDVVSEVSESLVHLSHLAEQAGIHKWLQVVDPGIGFAKDLNDNLLLLKCTNDIRCTVSNIPLLVGPSRKGFIGRTTGEAKVDDRDFGTLSSCLVAIMGANKEIIPTILRVHNVKGIKQGLTMFEAILDSK